jgi:hypothetical protein
MKKLSLLLLLLCHLSAFSCDIWGVEFAEITFYQDSANPMTIHVVCKIKGIQCGNAPILWGDGTTSDIPFVDSFYIDTNLTYYPQMPVSIYEGSHTYSSAYSDSIVLIGLGIYSEYNYITNNGNYGHHLVPEASVNLAYLKNHTGFKAPTMAGYYQERDTVKRFMSYDPMIGYDTSYTIKAVLIKPNEYYPTGDMDMSWPYLPGLTIDTLTVDSTTGLLVWNSPQYLGNFLIGYQVCIYKNDTLIGFMSRDMAIQIVDTIVNTTGINSICDGQPLRCYPSPTSGSFTIDMTGYSVGERQISIYDQLGQVVYQTTASRDKLQVNNKLSPGVYTVMVVQDAQRANTRLIVQ